MKIKLIIAICAIAGASIFSAQRSGATGIDLGEFRVRDVLEKVGESWQSDCMNRQDADGTALPPDSACHQRFFAMRSESALAFAQEDPYSDTSQLDTFIFAPSLLSPKCDYYAAGGRSNLLDGNMCKALHAPNLDANGELSYFYSPTMNPETDDIVNAVTVFAVTGMPIGYSTAYETRLSANDPSPSSFEVHAMIRGVVLFIPTHIEKRFLMERIGN